MHKRGESEVREWVGGVSLGDKKNFLVKQKLKSLRSFQKPVVTVSARVWGKVWNRREPKYLSGCNNGSCIIETLIETSNFFVDFIVRCT